MKKRYIRKKYFIDPSLQLGYLIIILFSMVLTAGVVYFSIWSVFLEKIGQLESQTGVVSLFKEMVAAVFSKTNKLLCCQLPILFGLMIFFSIFFSHRITGPLYRIEQNLERLVGKGYLLDEIKLRKYDHPRIIAFTKNLNRSISALREKVGMEKDLEEKLSLLVKRMEEGPSLFPQVKEELAAIIAEIQKSIKKYQDG